MKKTFQRLLYLCTAFLILGLVGIFALPPVLKPYLERKASEALQREVHLGQLTLNPFLFKLGVQDLSIKDRYGEFFAAKSIVLDAELMSLIRGGPVLREITIDAPRVQIIRLSEFEFNFSDLLKAKSPPDESGETLRFALNNIRVIQGDFRLDDRFKQVKLRLDQLELALPFVSNMPQRIDEYIAPALSGRINGKAFALKGQSKPFKDSHDTSLRFSAAGIDITDYLSYAPIPAELKVLRGQLNAELDVVFRQEKDRADVVLNGQLHVNQLQLQVQQQDALQVGKIAIELGDLKPFLGDFHFKRIDIDGMALMARRNAQGQINWLALASAPANQAQRQIASAARREREKSAQPSQFKVEQFTLKNSQLTWRDEQVKPVFEQSLTDLSLSGQRWSSTAREPFPVVLSGKLNQSQLALTLQAIAAPLQVTGDVQLAALQLSDFAAYYSPFLNADLSGLVSAKMGVAFQAEPLQYQLKAGELQLEKIGVKLPKQAKPLIKLDQLALSQIELDSRQQTLDIGQLASKTAHIELAWLPNKQLNVMDILPPNRVASSPAPRAASASAAWRVKLANLQLDDYTLRLEDRMLSKPTPILVKNINLNLQNLDTQPGTKAVMKLSAKAGRATSLNVAGPFVAQPFSGQWQIDARSVDAAYVQPYFSRYLNISLASGFVDAKGRLNLNTSPKFSGAYQGEIGVRQFYALDKATGDDFLKWKNLTVSGIKTDFDPLKVDIAELKLDQFFSRLILSPNGRMNVQDIMVGDAGAASVTRESTVQASPKADSAVASQVAKGVEKAAPIPIRIGKITLSRGNIRYSDLLIRPNYTANLTDMSGQLSGISSQNDTRAKLDLSGSLDKTAPVRIQGALNPLAKDVFFDIKGGVKGYELTSASTYAEKYAGYGISKGKLSMDVAYFIENGQLKASNQIFLDQLTLSDEASNSPEATKLPVKFALSLLTDRQGQIKLNLPIEGALNDPEFRVGAVIWQVIGNVMEKIVTAPFDMLAGAFADGPSLSYITFEPGSARLNESAQTALQRVSEMLADRPALKLEISGWADLALDGEGLKERQLRQKMRALKAEKLGMATESIESENALAITEAEQDELIAAVYRQSKFEKPSNLLGLSKKLPTDEMKTLILKNTVVGEQDLRLLANQRAQRVERALKEAGLPAERIFMTTALLNPPTALTDKDQGPASRVQFKLQ